MKQPGLVLARVGDVDLIHCQSASTLYSGVLGERSSGDTAPHMPGFTSTTGDMAGVRPSLHGGW
jgi:hypothetical protein